MKVDVSGTRNGLEWPPRGSVLDLPDDEAAEYCRTGMAEPVAVFTEFEQATVPEPEVRAGSELRTDTESGAALRRGRPRTQKTGV